MAGFSDAWAIQLGAFENDMKNLTSQNTVMKRHTHSISMSFCGCGAQGKCQHPSSHTQLCQADCEAVKTSNYEFSSLVNDQHLFC